MNVGVVGPGADVISVQVGCFVRPPRTYPIRDTRTCREDEVGASELSPPRVCPPAISHTNVEKRINDPFVDVTHPVLDIRLFYLGKSDT